MKLIIEIEIREGIEKELERVISVKCDGKELESETDSIGRACGRFWRLPGPEKDDCFCLDLVEWEQ